MKKWQFLFLLCLFLLFNVMHFEVSHYTFKTEIGQFYESAKLDVRKITNLAVFIKFSDNDEKNIHHIDDDECLQNAQKIFNSDELFAMDSVNGLIKVPSVKKYFEQQSYGKISVITEFFPKENHSIMAYKDVHPIGYYLKYNENNLIGYKSQEEANQREKELLEGALQKISKNILASSLTASDLDTDDDGLVDNVMFIVEGQKNLPSNIGWNDLLWSHKSDYKGIQTKILDKEVSSYNLLYATDYTEATGLFSMNRGTYGTIIHEFGHTLGFMDLYRYHSSASPVGFYDVMGNVVGSNPQNFLTYFISEYYEETNWHSPIPVISKTTKNITLQKPTFSNDSENRAVKLQIDGKDEEYFIVEYYEKQNTYNTYTADKSGLIIYRVNERFKYLGNGSSEDHIYVFRPNESGLGNGLGDLVKATLHLGRPIFGKQEGTQKEFDPETIHYANGKNSGIVVEVTGETEDSITFSVYFKELNGSGTKDDPYLITSVDDFYYFMNLNTFGKYYRLETDLDFSSSLSYPEINFTGNLDGNYHTLKNITAIGNGLFKNVGSYDEVTTIENLFLEHLTISSTSGDYLGGFANSAENVILKNIHLLSGSVSNTSHSLNTLASTGGFIGTVSSNVIIKDCTSSVSVTSPKNVGGFIGMNNNATFQNCFMNGVVVGKEKVGSFIGLQSITDSAYKVPEKIFYEGQEKAVGGYANYLHNLNVLNEKELDKGIRKIAISDQIKMQKGENLEYFREKDLLNAKVTIQHSNVVNLANGMLVALKGGTSVIQVYLTFGQRTFLKETQVLVNEFATNIFYSSQVQNKGWLTQVENGETTGTTGLGLRVETLKIALDHQEFSGDVVYRSHIENLGWESKWKKNGEVSGTVGKGLRLEAIEVCLTGEMANYFDVYYRTHVQNFGWLGWAKNGASAGSSGYGYRIEAIEVMLVKKGDTPSLNTINSFKQKVLTPSINYKTQVQNIGWMSEVKDGESSGTSGKGLRLETLQACITNSPYAGGIEYRSHVENIGWELSWKKNGESSGTIGKGLRLEAVQMRLTGNLANYYDLYYRVHVQNIGWMGWAKNGSYSGTSGYGYRIEAIEIKLVKKGEAFFGSLKDFYRYK